ncbi:MAG: sigma-70 family RNA polymerase sigma factor [Planctomycetota bacterium]
MEQSLQSSDPFLSMPDSDPEPAKEGVDVAQWVDRFGDSLFRFAMAKIGEATTAEDLVQETFLAAISGKQRFRNDATVSTWLFAILKRKVADHYRRAGRRTEKRAESVESPPVETSRDWDQDPATIYEDREFWETFDRCIEKLPNKLAEVYILREVNQHSPQEIREILNISATNLSMRLQRCRLALRDCLQRNWFVEDE